MKHKLLFALRIEHAYYEDGRGRALALRPRPESAKRLAGRRLLARELPGGLDILAEVGDDDRPLINLEAGLSLRFDLLPVDPELALFTELAELRGHARPLLRNTGDGPLSLSEGELPPARGALAVVEIAGVEGAWTGAPPSFAIRLRPRQTHWVYYYVGSEAEVEIRDEDPERGDAPLEFEVEDAAPEDDRVASDLASRYPEHTRLRLVSREPLPCRAAPRRHLALRAGKLVLASELANPSLRRQSIIVRDGQPKDSLYEVLAPSTAP